MMTIQIVLLSLAVFYICFYIYIFINQNNTYKLEVGSFPVDITSVSLRNRSSFCTVPQIYCKVFICTESWFSHIIFLYDRHIEHVIYRVNPDKAMLDVISQNLFSNLNNTIQPPQATAARLDRSAGFTPLLTTIHLLLFSLKNTFFVIWAVWVSKFFHLKNNIFLLNDLNIIMFFAFSLMDKIDCKSNIIL